MNRNYESPKSILNNVKNNKFIFLIKKSVYSTLYHFLDVIRMSIKFVPTNVQFPRYTIKLMYFIFCINLYNTLYFNEFNYFLFVAK